MITPDRATDARLGLLAAYAFDMHAGTPLALEPPPDPRLAPEWALRGYVTGRDALFRKTMTIALAPTLVAYGYLAESLITPGVFVLAIRGTDGIEEWIEDAEFLMTAHPVGGQVEAGFYGIYRNLAFQAIGGQLSPLIDGIVAAIGPAAHVTVVGHSLGAAVATYATLDLNSRLPAGAVRGRFYASPRPGDVTFSDLFEHQVADYQAYAYELDVVPRVPFGMGYVPLLRLNTIRVADAQARIGMSITCWHHVWCYVACLDFSLMTWGTVPRIDQALTACIRGPRAA